MLPALRFRGFLFFLLELLLGTAAGAPDVPGVPDIVLVLHSGEVALPPGNLIDPPMREELASHARDSVLVRTEELNSYENLAVADEEALVQQLAAKYASQRVRLLMPSGIVALEFALRHADRLWPQVPIVYYGIGAELHLLDAIRLPPRVSGVAVSTDIARTIELMRALQPRARDLVLVAGSSPYDRRWIGFAQRTIARSTEGLRVTWLTGLPLAELQARLDALPPDTGVVFLSMLRDGAGHSYINRDVVRRLAASASVPVYGVLESTMGSGIVGGSMQDYAAGGRQAGMMAAQILNGDRDPPAGTVRKVAPRCQADARQLRRWGFHAWQLPEGCELQFSPPSPNGTELAWAAVGASTALLALLFGVGMALERRGRTRAEHAARASSQELAHATRLSVAGQLSGSVAHEIRQPLAAIMTNVAAAELLLRDEAPDVQEMRDIVADIRKADARAQRVIERLSEFLRSRELRFETLALKGVVDDAIALVQQEATRRGVRIRRNLPSALPEVRGDSVHLEQVILNLLLNALDACESVPDAGVDVRAWQDGEEIVVEVADQGRGIRLQDLPHLFEPFYTSKPKGMGLGLSIARMVVESHHGRIIAANRPQGGARFSISLPVA
jgi:signal transduction histidine kinase/ABC-type uncharacterized transport system substrate-binding protein